MSTTVTRPTYTEDEKRTALVIYASQSGREDLVLPMLEQAGLGHVGIRTLRSWVYRDRKEEYEQIKQEYGAFVRSQAADTYRAAASLAAEVANEALQQTAEALRNGDITPKDLPKVAREAMLAAGIATDKGELLSGNPTAIVKTEIGDLQRELASVGVTIVMPGGAPLPEVDDQRADAVTVTAHPELPTANTDEREGPDGTERDTAAPAEAGRVHGDHPASDPGTGAD